MRAPRWPWVVRVPIACLVAVVLTTAAAVADLRAQDDRRGGPASASLLRRLAASADAYRTGDTVYVVIADSFPHSVLGVFESPIVAGRMAGPGFHYYATATPRDIPARAIQVLPGCYKDPRTTQWFCPQDTLLRPIPLDSVRMIELVIHRVNGEPVRVAVRPDRVSAFILTLDGFDRHMVPYYTQLLGARAVAAMRDSLVAYLSR